MSRKWVKGGLLVASPFISLFGIILPFLLLFGSTSIANTSCTNNGAVTLAPGRIRIGALSLTVGGVTLGRSQLHNAELVMGTASTLRVRQGNKDARPSPRDVKVGLMTAMQESTFINYPVGAGDLDSGGVFQQRPSQGWGTPAQVHDVVHASTEFFDRLLAVPNRNSLSLEVEAINVQHPNPAAYNSPTHNFNMWGGIADALLRYYHPSNSNSRQRIGNDTGCAVGGHPNSRVEIAVEVALSQIGLPYVWGGESTKTGFDCSGLVQYAFRVAGISLPRVAADQYNYPKGVHVTKKQLQRGDLVFWADSTGYVDHVAIYLGNDKIVAAPHTGADVEIEQLWSSSGGLHFVGGLRVASPSNVLPTSGLKWQLPLPTLAVASTFNGERGFELVAPRGTPVVSAGAGTVVTVGQNGLLGKYITIQDQKGEILTYAHLLQTDKGINAGKQVKSGDLIAEVGSSGAGIGDRLLFIVQNKHGNYLDPVQFLRAHGVRP